MKIGSKLKLLLKTNSFRKDKTRLTHNNHLNDLDNVEDMLDRSFFIDIGLKAAQNAINENKAMRLPITFFQDGWILRRMPSGDIQRILEIKIKGEQCKNRTIVKGTILNISRISPY